MPARCWRYLSYISLFSHSLHLSVRRVQLVLRSLKEKGYVRVLQEATPYAPPTYRIVVPREGDVERFAAERMRDSQRSVSMIRSAANLSVPGQAGTNINPNKEQKEEQEGPIDKREKRKCALRGCPRVTYEEFCGVHTEESGKG